MANLDGLGQPSDIDDFLTRASLLFPSLGFSAERREFLDRAKAAMGMSPLDEALEASRSGVAEGCLARFAAIESDISSSVTKGLGRVSAVGFPRLGGVLHGELRKKPEAASFVRAAVELTVHSGYLAVILQGENFRKRDREVTNPDELWTQWIPVSYSTTQEMFDCVYGIAAVMSFWRTIVESLGLSKMAKQLRKDKTSPLSSSLSGLATTGAALAFVERGMIRK